MSTTDYPQVFDVGRRVARTIIQTGIPTFLALVTVIPLILSYAGKVLTPDQYVRLAAVAAAITGAAGVLTRIMADPRVNALLAKLHLDAPTTRPEDEIPMDTTMITAVKATNSGEFLGTGAN